MINNIKVRLQDKDKRRVLENFLSLSILQGINCILPLITLPYLVRVIGPGHFGLIAFAQAFIQYFNILTDYGFNLSATRAISTHRDDKIKISEIFSSVMVIKCGLLLISLILLTIIVFSFKKFHQDWEIYYLTFGIVVGQVLFPVWFFEGIERMKYITFLNVISKLIFTISIFIFIHKASDYLYVPVLNSFGSLVAGILAIYIVVKNFKIIFKFPQIEQLKHQLKEGWCIFISTVAVAAYKSSSIFILGLFASNEIVGYFSVAKKLIDVVNSMASIISRAIYPYTVKNMIHYLKKSLKFLKLIGIFITIYTSILAIVFIFFANKITILLTGNMYYATAHSIELLAFVPFLIGINVPAVHILLANKLDNIFSKIVISGSIIDIILNFILVPNLSYIGSCIAVIVTESYVSIMLYIFAFKYLRRSHEKHIR